MADNHPRYLDSYSDLPAAQEAATYDTNQPTDVDLEFPSSEVEEALAQRDQEEPPAQEDPETVDIDSPDVDPKDDDEDEVEPDTNLNEPEESEAEEEPGELYEIGQGDEAEKLSLDELRQRAEKARGADEAFRKAAQLDQEARRLTEEAKDQTQRATQILDRWEEFKSNPMAVWTETMGRELGPVDAAHKMRDFATSFLDDWARRVEALPEDQRHEAFRLAEQQHHRQRERELQEELARVKQQGEQEKQHLERARQVEVFRQAIKGRGLDVSLPHVCNGVVEEVQRAEQSGEEIDADTAVDRYLERTRQASLEALNSLPLDVSLDDLPPALREKFEKAQKKEQRTTARSPKRQPQARRAKDEGPPSTYDPIRRRQRRR